MSRLKPYKGYTAVVEVDDEAGVIQGRVSDLRDVVHFQSSSVAGLRKAFREAVDDYLQWCLELGEEPDRAYSGRVLVRMEPDLHRSVARCAEVGGVSINGFIVAAVEQACDTVGTRDGSSGPLERGRTPITYAG